MYPSPAPAALDLTRCDREPIHVPGAIQPHGVLFVLREPGLEVVQVSENVFTFFGVPAERLIGQSLDAVLPASLGDRLLQRVEGAPLDRPLQLLPALDHPGGPQSFDVLVHRVAGGLVLELELRPEEGGDVPAQLQDALDRMQSAGGVQALCDVAAREVRCLTGFDRVKIYRFDADWHGETIAEARADHMDSYLGLHFPASDIPAQARRLYALNRLRIIPDVGYTPARIVPALNPATGAPLDLSFSVLRSVSPVHVEYLRNMGVGASMSISILREGRLWGLVACHHAGPYRVPYRVRAACELLGQVLGLLLATTQEVEDRQQQVMRRERQARLLEAMVREDDFVAGLAASSDDLVGLTGARGAAVVSRDRCLRFGDTPPEEAVLAFTAWLEAQPPGEPAGEPFETDRLARSYPPAAAFQETASGVLAITLSRLERHYVLWFRPEVLQTVYWAGDPNKAVAEGAAGDGRPAGLHPRTSFQAWKDTLRGRALPWEAAEVEAARELRRAISDVVFVKMEKLARLNTSLETANTALKDANARLRREVEEREQAEAALEQANLWLRQRNRELQDFAYVASHDLQEPLRKIRSFSNLLQTEHADQLDEAGRDYLARMVTSAERMSALIADLLGFSRVVTHAEPFEEVNLQRLFEWIVQDLDPVIEESGARVEAGALPRIEADPGQMRRLFLNLISNALKFHRPGVPPVLRIDCEPGAPGELPGIDGPVYRLRFVDNGVGFDEKYLDRIFLPFQQLYARGTYEGTGIGLAISKRIVERHGGTLTAHSTPGAGSTFVVTLPAHPPVLPRPRDRDAAR